MKYAMKCEYAVTEKLFVLWAVERIFKGVRLIVSLMFCLLAGLSFGQVLSGGLKPLFAVLTIVFLYFAFYRDIHRAKKEYNALTKEYGGYDWKCAIMLEEDRIVLEEGMMDRSEYPYSHIKDAFERKDHFCLVMRGGERLRLYKSGLGEHTADECWAMIEKKMDEAIVK